jgi:DNA-binding transcriptional regulator YdaS (Cro superfamily)
VSTAGYLYAVAFSDGTVKIGRANQAHHRIAAHRRHAAVFGIEIAETYVVQVPNSVEGELVALMLAEQRLGVTRRAREWFSGLCFADAKECVNAGRSATWAARTSPLARAKDANDGAVEIRRQNLARLIASRFGGNQTHFARALGVKPPQVNRWVSTTAADPRSISEQSARAVEAACGLPPGWLDGPGASVVDQQPRMTKADAIALAGGRAKALADAVGVTQSAISQWPDVLPARLADRVTAAVHRARTGAPS